MKYRIISTIIVILAVLTAAFLFGGCDETAETPTTYVE